MAAAAAAALPPLAPRARAEPHAARAPRSRRVGRPLIKTVAQPTLVVWGTDDDILPLSDAYAFEQDLQQCVAVKEVAGSGHSPHLDNPDVVVNHLKEFILS